MRISDWSSDVCSSDLVPLKGLGRRAKGHGRSHPALAFHKVLRSQFVESAPRGDARHTELRGQFLLGRQAGPEGALAAGDLFAQLQEYLMIERNGLLAIDGDAFVISGGQSGLPNSASAEEGRSEEHTSELQSLMRISY